MSEEKVCDYIETLVLKARKQAVMDTLFGEASNRELTK